MARWVQLEWPEEFKSHAQEMLNKCDLVVRNDDGVLRVTTDRQYTGAHRPIVRFAASSSASAITDRPMRQALQGLAQNGMAEVDDPRVRREFERLLLREELHLNNALQALWLRVLTEKPESFADQVSNELVSIATLVPSCRVYIVPVRPAFHSTESIVRGLITAQEGSEWLSEQQPLLSSMRGLSGGMWSGRPNVLEPFFASRFPRVPGFVCTRLPGGFLVLLFGEWLTYRRDVLDNHLDGWFDRGLLSDGLTEKAPAQPLADVMAVEEALRWWVGQAAELLEVVLDPTLWVHEGTDTYFPALQFGAMHAVERIFASTTSALLSRGRDAYSRRIHLFEVLDLIEGLKLGGTETTLTPSRARKVLDQVRSKVPHEVAAVLLPRCEEAVDALASLEAGFPSSVRASGEVDLGGSSPVSMDNAIARYMRLMRNGSHALVNTVAKNPEDRRLLALHDGSVPDAISDLALLRLLWLLAEPEVLRRPWTKRYVDSR